MYRLFLVTALAVTVLAACAEQGDHLVPRDTDGTLYEGPYEIDAVEAACTPGVPDAWQFQVETLGWAARVTLEIAYAGLGDGETHDLENADYDQGGAWDVWSLTLLRDPTHHEPSATTAWACDDQDDLAFRVQMYGADAPTQVSDCVWWGADPEGTFGGDCACVEPGACTS